MKKAIVLLSVSLLSMNCLAASKVNSRKPSSIRSYTCAGIGETLQLQLGNALQTRMSLMKDGSIVSTSSRRFNFLKDADMPRLLFCANSHGADHPGIMVYYFNAESGELDQFPVYVNASDNTVANDSNAPFALHCTPSS